MLEWEFKKVPIGKLKVQDANPRQISVHDAKNLQASIETFGMCEPIVVNADMTIIGGHQRYRTAKKLKHTHVDIFKSRTHLDDKQIKELTIRLNRNCGDWDYDVLADRFDVDDLLSWGMTESDLEIEKICEEKPSKPPKIIIDFAESDHLEDAETKIAELLTAYQGSTYRIKR